MANWLAKALQEERGKTKVKTPSENLESEVMEYPPCKPFGTRKRRRLMGQRVKVTKIIKESWRGSLGSIKHLDSIVLSSINFGYIVGFRNKYEGVSNKLDKPDPRGFNRKFTRTRIVPVIMIAPDPATNPYMIPLDGFMEFVDPEIYRNDSNDYLVHLCSYFDESVRPKFKEVK